MSLLERMDIDKPSSGSLGVQRTKSKRGGNSPYSRPEPLPKGDINQRWQHDMAPLEGRISDQPRAAPKYNFSGASVAAAQAAGTTGGLSIKGAGAEQHNVIEVKGLVAGTTAEDVKAIFQQCGPVTQAKLMDSTKEDPVVRLVYKNAKDAKDACKKFDGQNADGKKLVVKIIGTNAATLGARLGSSVVEAGSVDALLDSANGGSKMRSDAIIAQDARAIVQVAPPGADPAEYVQSGHNGRGRGRGRGGKRRGGGGGRKRGGAAGGMEVDA